MVAAEPTRQFPRHAVQCPIRYRTPGADAPQRQSGWTRNLSAGGVGLITELPLPDGADIWVSLFLTIDEIEDESTEPLPVPGKIQWATEIEPGVHHLGVKFGEIDPAEREVLRSFLVQVGSR